MKPYFETSHSESCWTFAVERFYATKQRVKVVGYFWRRAPSWIFDRILNASLTNNLLQLEESLRRGFPSLGLNKGILDIPCLPPNSLDLHQTQKQQDEILDSPRVLISLSNARNKNIKNSSTKKIRLTRVTSSRAVVHKSWWLNVPLFSWKPNLYYTFITYDKRKSNERRAKSN